MSELSPLIFRSDPCPQWPLEPTKTPASVLGAASSRRENLGKPLLKVRVRCKASSLRISYRRLADEVAIGDVGSH